jgi:hypothetical protein
LLQTNRDFAAQPSQNETLGKTEPNLLQPLALSTLLSASESSEKGSVKTIQITKYLLEGSKEKVFTLRIFFKYPQLY